MAKSDLTNIHTTNKVAKKVIFHNFHMSKKKHVHTQTRFFKLVLRIVPFALEPIFNQIL